MHPWTALMLRAHTMTTNMLETRQCLRRSRWNRAALRSTSPLVQPRVPGRKLTTTCSLGVKRTGFNAAHSTRLTAELLVVYKLTRLHEVCTALSPLFPSG